MQIEPREGSAKAPSHNTKLSFSDQFAFCPTGSTTATLITILQSVTSLLVDNPYVAVMAVDSSKAFDVVRHATLLDKMAQLKYLIMSIIG